jgi:hypothetical protein
MHSRKVKNTQSALLEKKMKQITLEYSEIRQEVQEIKKILKIKSLMMSR